MLSIEFLTSSKNVFEANKDLMNKPGVNFEELCKMEHVLLLSTRDGYDFLDSVARRQDKKYEELGNKHTVISKEMLDHIIKNENIINELFMDRLEFILEFVKFDTDVLCIYPTW